MLTCCSILINLCGIHADLLLVVLLVYLIGMWLSRWRHVARVNASKAFGPFLLLEDMKGSLEEVKNKMMKEHSKKLKLWYDSLGGDAIGLTWERVGSMKREQEEASEEETDPIEVLKAVGELGKGFLKDIYSLKAPWLMS
ncbi:hypothetical protein KPL71_003659 [Citrus sinensis]|uniref:Uncharacterized protein n=1 Tax=Citrus sinensis TaxID=2711 RepID=A0ACB8MZD2_CITSI|nr:hypothetical protein KPL71_003659 [Citrus sinensis]